MSGIPTRTKNNLISVLAQEPSVESAVLFGSRARGDTRPNSDIDIALKGENIPIGLNTRIRDSIGIYQIDIVRLEGLDNKPLLSSIERDGILIYSKGDAATTT